MCSRKNYGGIDVFSVNQLENYAAFREYWSQHERSVKLNSFVNKVFVREIVC